eukprot:gb/GFBE01009936.1/.p1 GENE.gb/GFBE01009936.1/~~gb/GFBE01009936.1/.p1  ORF type:complete len:911 (+),score=347.66 gb/GFBE01009936.1/:1-2733(+)
MAQRTLLLIALGVGLAAAQLPGGLGDLSNQLLKKPCARDAIEGDFQDCLETSELDACKEELSKQMRDECGEAMDATKLMRFQKEAAQKLLAACKMDGDATDCATKFANITGSKGMDAAAAALHDRFASEKGAAGALAEKMGDCKDDKETCMEEAKKAMMNLTGRAVSDVEFKQELMKAGAAKAKDVISGCMQNATTEDEKEACFSSMDAKMEAAKASGKNVSEISNEDLRKFARKGAMGDMAEVMKACVEAAGNNKTAKKACAARPDLKDSIAMAMGKDADKVTDSMVRDFLDQQAQSDALAMLKSCNASERAKCAEEAKQLRAQASGMDLEDITDDFLEKDAMEAMFRELGDKMTACVEDAEDNETKKASCKMDMVKKDLKMAALSKMDWEPSMADVERALEKAAESKAGQIAKDCQDSRHECMEKLRKEAAKAMGKKLEDLSDVDVERLNKKSAMDAAKVAAEACFAAKKDDVTATCEDPFATYMEGRKEDVPKDDTERDAMEKKMKVEFAIDMQKDVMSVCFEKASKTAADACLANFTDQLEGVAGTLFAGADTANLQKKMKRTLEEAGRQLVGEVFHACMKAALSDGEKDKCKEEMEKKAEVAGIMEDADDVAMRFRTKSVADAVTSCNATKRAECKKQIMDELKQAGMKPRAFGVVKKLAAVKAAAEIWAGCEENATNSGEKCLMLASQELAEVLGAPDSWNETADEVKRLGEALLNGISTVLRKLEKVDVDAVTSGTTCLDGELDMLRTKLAAGAAAFDQANMTDRPANLSNATINLKGCSLVDGKAQYAAAVLAAGLNETEMSMLADKLAEALDGVDLAASRRLGRRLAAVTDAYADQAVQECAENDATCGGGGGTDSSTTAAGGGQSSTTTAGGAGGGISGAFAQHANYAVLLGFVTVSVLA